MQRGDSISDYLMDKYAPAVDLGLIFRCLMVFAIPYYRAPIITQVICGQQDHLTQVL